MPGVIDAEASFGASTLNVTYDPAAVSYDAVLQRIDQLGYGTLEAERAKERTQTFAVEGMDCADCAAKLESRLRRLDGVSAARVDFALARLTVTYSPARVPEASLRAAAGELGYRLSDERPARAPLLALRPSRDHDARLGRARDRRASPPRRSRRRSSRSSLPPPWSPAAPTWHGRPSTRCVPARST